MPKKRKPIEVLKEKESQVEKDFQNIKYILEGTSLKKRTMESSRIKIIALAIVDYAGARYRESCMRLYDLYSIKPWGALEEINLTQKIKNFLKESADLYGSAKQNPLFFEQFKKILAPH